MREIVQTKSKNSLNAYKFGHHTGYENNTPVERNIEQLAAMTSLQIHFQG
jgi:hypothetical protein